MKRLRWLTSAAVLAIHEDLIARYGGASGLRVSALLESAIARPKHVATYETGVRVPQWAAGYAWGLLRNHPFLDGNKRVALAAMTVFLDLNGWELACNEVEETTMILKAAAGEISERVLRSWVVRRAVKKEA